MQIEVDSIRDSIKAQFNISWSLLEYHFDGLDDNECLWKPCSRGINVEKKPEGWIINWPESEAYEVGPPNIAWLTWHITFWWSMVFDYSFGKKILRREDITLPDTIADVKRNIFQLRQDWLNKLDSLSDEEFVSTELTKWPFEDKPFYDLAAWLNLELMKNASEIGFCRFLYACRNE